MKFLGITTLIGIAAVIMISLFSNYHYENELDGWLYRAQVGAEANDMQNYLKRYAGKLEEKGLTHGNYAVWFKTPKNSFSPHYQSVERLIERLDEIKELDKSGTAYQTALDDIRDTIGEFPELAGWLTWVNFWWLYWIVGILTFISIIVFSSNSR